MGAKRPHTKRILTRRSLVTVTTRTGEPDHISIRAHPNVVVELISVPLPPKDREAYDRECALEENIERSRAKSNADKLMDRWRKHWNLEEPAK